MEKRADKVYSSTDSVKSVENTNSSGLTTLECGAYTDQNSSSPTDDGSSGKLQKSQLPNRSFDGSPFVNFQVTKLRKKKTQSKLTYTKKTAPSTATSPKKKCVSASISYRNDSESKKLLESEGKFISSSVEVPTDSSAECLENVDSKKENRVRVCPVCWKKFETESNQMVHMKACVVKHNLTLKQLLDALDLQSKQIEERKILGLPCVTNTIAAKRNVSKKNSYAKDRNDPDFQLGLALSVSMKETEEQSLLVEQEVMMEAGLSDEVAANQASLLERFGFTSTRPVLQSVHSRTRPGKPKLKKKGTPLLMMRSQEERERLITEKVAIILASEEENGSISCASQNQLSSGSRIKSEILSVLQIKDVSLWKKASASPCFEDCNLYYVDFLSHVITPSKTKAGSKLKHLSQVPCRLKTPEKHSSTTVEHFNSHGVSDSGDAAKDNSYYEHDQLNAEQTSILSCHNLKGKTPVRTVSMDKNVLNTSCEFACNLAENWRLLLNNKSKSDLVIHVKDGQEIPVHELVLFVRCPNILHDMIQTTTDTGTCIRYIKWDDISFQCALAFLDFIYCGSKSKIDELNGCISEVMFLCKKYNVEELLSYLEHFIQLRKKSCVQYSYQESDYQGNGRINCLELVSTQENDLSSILCGSQVQSSEETTPSKSIECNLNHNSVSKRDNKDCISKSDSLCQENDISYKLCSSPDPFSDICDYGVSSIPLNRKSSSPNTQQNMDCLLEALDDEDSKSYCSGSNDYAGNSKICCLTTSRKSNMRGNSGTEKRKLSDCTYMSDTKRICVNDQKSARKSLLCSFSDEGKDMLTNDRDIKLNLSSRSCGNASVISVECIETVSVESNDSFIEEEMEMQCSKIQISTKERSENELYNHMTDKSSKGDSAACIEEKSQYVQDRENEMYMNALGDFCADYEYQNFHANYSFYGQTPSPNVKDYGNKSIKDSPLKEQKTCEIENLADVNKTPHLSPISLKSMHFGVSPVSSEEKVCSTQKQTLCRTKSSSDISVNSFSPLSSPILVKCLSQSSVHLKTSPLRNNALAEKSNRKIQPSQDTETDVLKSNVSSEVLLTPITPLTQIARTSYRSLKSLKCMLEDSFTEDLEKNNWLSVGDLENLPCSTPLITDSRISVRKLQVEKQEENCVTPMADYSTMDTPRLKRELQKYGLKPLKRKGAKQILRHIYNELHPMVSTETDDKLLIRRKDEIELSIPCSTLQADKELEKAESHKIKCNLWKEDKAIRNSTGEADISSEDDYSFPSTQESSSSSQCEFEVPEDLAEDNECTQTDVSELPTVVHNFIMHNPAFHQQVLLFEPIWLEQLQDALKTQNYKFKLNHLMEYLDEKCITFRTAQGKHNKRKQKKREIQ